MKLETMRQILQSGDIGLFQAEDSNDPDLSYAVMACNQFPKLLDLAEKAKTLRHSPIVYMEGMFPAGERILFDFLEAVDRCEASE